MVRNLKLLLVISFVFLTACVQQEQLEVTELEWQEDKSILGMQSLSAFELTLHPLLVASCSGCHGDSGPQLKHSSSNVIESFGVIESNKLVNLTNSSESLIVKKIKQGHMGYPSALANDIQTEIDLWAAKIQGIDNEEVASEQDGGAEGSTSGESDSEGETVAPLNASEIAFKDNLQSVLVSNCSGCHASGNPLNLAAHADDDTRVAHSALINGSLVQLNNAVQSLIVTKIANGHNGINAGVATDIQEAIVAWNTALGGTQMASTSEVQFGDTLLPLLQLQCTSCHGDNGSQIKHSSSDRATAFSVVSNNNLANLNYPDSSSMVAKVKAGHNCWSGNCDNDSLALQNAITNWSVRLNLNPQSSSSTGSEGLLSSSEIGFRDNLQPLLVTNCASCHGASNSLGIVAHADSDPKTAHATIMNGSLVDLGNTANSKLVTKVKNFHNCWSGDCDADSLALQNAITAWASSINIASDDEIAFGNTLHPILAQNCKACHGDTNHSLSKHASVDRAVAYKQVISNNLADLDKPYLSAAVAKIKTGHNCWSGNCDTDANTLESAITAWAVAVGKNPQNEDTNTSSSTFDRVASAEAFKTSVHPILTTNCSSCHSPEAGSAQAPFHSQPDYVKAHDAVVDTARVDFANIPNSRLVKRLSEDRHYCWGDCGSNAATMQAAIETWASKVDTTGVAVINGAKTSMKSIISASVELPETILGSIMMQAEDGVLEGRYETRVDSQASNLAYVGMKGAGAHPIEGTGRRALLRQSCRAVKSGDLDESVNGLVRYSEQRRHMSQSGYRYYSMLLSARIVRPQYKDQFYAAVKVGQYENIERFLLRSGRPSTDNDDQSLVPVPLTTDGGDGGVDRNMTRNWARTLPEFANYTLWKDTIEKNASSHADFFAPKYGVNSDQFWTATESQIRAAMINNPEYLRELTKQVIEQYRNWFFDRRDPDGSAGPLPTTNWDAENGIRSLPYSLRRLSDGTQFVTILSDRSNYTAAINSSISFFNQYMDGLTTYDEAKDDNFSEAYVRALQPISSSDSTPRIMKYVYFFMDPTTRNFADFSVRHRRADNTSFTRFYDINKGTVNLDLKALFTGGSALDARQIAINNYGTTLKPILATNCVQCHGDGSGRPQFAQSNDTRAYDAAAAVSGFINYLDPRSARPVQRMLDDRHNCGDATTCDNLGNQMIAAINDWNSKNISDQAAAASSDDDGLIALSDRERTPGRARYKINITQAGDYNVWLKMKTPSNLNNDVRIRVLDDQKRPVRSCRADETCITTEEYYSSMRSIDELEDIGCEEYQPGTRPEWEWFTPNINNSTQRRKWTLGKGIYYLEVIEDEVGSIFDLVALSANPEFNPAKNLVDEGIIQNPSPKILKYDLSSLLGTSGTFEIEVVEKDSGDAYIFRNPRFRGVSSNIRFRNLKILVNNQYEFANSTYTKLNRVVSGLDSGILTTSSLVALAINGPSVDTFSFVFEDLTLTDQPVETLDEDAPVPVEGRQCLNLDLFAKTVMPVLNNFRLVLKDDYLDYTDNEFPATGGDEAGNLTTYNCTTCHNEQHPYFKMTTFADGLSPGDPIPADGLEKLCAQAISRVDFGNFERSLLLRGLNGTFNHPKLHFVQRATISGSGSDRAFITSTTDPSGYATDFIGFRFEKWTSSEIDLSSYSNQEDKEYLAQFLGRYKRVRYRQYDDPFALYDQENMAEGDILSVNELGEGVLTRQTNPSGKTLYDVIDPREALSLAANERPDPSGAYLVKEECFDDNYQTVDGITTDPCNANANVITEFEVLKQQYRESIINWMAEEKKLYDASK